MKTELKDVLHLYLWCKFIGKYKDFAHENNVMTLTYKDLEPNKFEYIKPILRELSDMTIEEFQELGLNNWEADKLEEEFKNYKHFDSISNAIYPKDFPKYLKMGFDLFNLIGTGQAINATTLKP